jgi:hypothetical protein
VANSKISALTDIVTLASGDEIAVNDVSVPGSRKATIQEIADFLGLGILPKVLASDVSSTSTTMAKVTALDTTLAVGTYLFDYMCLWQTATTTTAVKIGVNFSGTQTAFVVEGTGFEATTAASTGAADQTVAAFGLRAGGTGRVPSSTVAIYGPTSGAVINVNLQMVARGLITVSVAGDLQLYFGAEVAAAGTVKLMTGTTLRVQKVA